MRARSLQVCGIVMGIHGGVDGDLGGPFFSSRTSCCGESGTPKELLPVWNVAQHGYQVFDITYPKTCTDYHMCTGGHNVTFIKACDAPPLSPDDAMWSHSIYCPNWEFVRWFTQRLGAERNMYLTFTSLFFMPIGAGLADKQGRKPMFFFGHMMGIKSLTCNLLASLPWFIHHDPRAYLLYASGILSGMGSGGGPTGMAMSAPRPPPPPPSSALRIDSRLSNSVRVWPTQWWT